VTRFFGRSKPNIQRDLDGERPMMSASDTGTNRITLLAIDDVSIPFTHNLRLKMHRPKKHPGNPVLTRGGPGTADAFGVQFYGSIVQDEGIFKAWYVAIDPGYPEDPTSRKWFRPAYAESADGVHWTKPDLGLVEYDGSRKNNLVLVENGPLHMINLKVLVEPDDPDPARRYKMIGQTWWSSSSQGQGRVGKFQERGWGTLVPLVSADGRHWRLAIDTEPVDGLLPRKDMVLPRHHFEAAGGLYKWDGMYYASGQSGGGLGDWGYVHGVRSYSGREVVMHRSPDFVTWSKTSHVGFLRDSQHASFTYGEGEEAHEGVSVWNRGNVLIGLYGIWHGGPEWADITIDLGLLVSNDGVRFREPEREWAFLERGADSEWDQGGLLQGQGFANVGDETRIYYGAWDPRRTSASSRGGIGLAALPRDRFGSLVMQKPEGDAELITSPVSLSGCSRVLINASGVSERATLRVDLLDASEQPLPGFSGMDAALGQQSGFDCPVVWQTQLPEHSQTVRIKIAFAGEDRAGIALHALYIEDREESRPIP